MILSFELLLYSLLLGGISIFIIDLILFLLEKHIPLFENFPANMIEPKNIALFLYSYVIELIFFVLLPAVAYSWFYSSMPFTGMRGGVAISLFVLLAGIIPFAILIQFRIKLPVVYMLYQLFGILLKITGSLAIIGYLYSL